jgi:16S rRNA (cytidine1402-2'-O)-methyltransferase
MEAPHRNDAIVKDVIASCDPETRFCTATNLTLPDESIISKPVSEWQQNTNPSIHKEPTIFLLWAG